VVQLLALTPGRFGTGETGYYIGTLADQSLYTGMAKELLQLFHGISDVHV
jgi:hypothetical protein